MQTVHVSTYCLPSSYGSRLQALGLKSALAELGYPSVVEQVTQPPQENYKLPLTFRSPAQLIATAQRCLLYPRLRAKYKNTCRFIAEHIDTAYYPSLSAMKDALKEESLFLAGSDQIWRPDQLMAEFFLEFAPEGAKRLSYAASMGILDVPGEKKQEFSRLLRNFDSISVRESDSVPIVSSFSGKPAQAHIDPTFLCDSSQWRQLERPYPIRRPYILVYPIYWNPNLNAALKKLHHETGKDILVLGNYRRNVYANKWIFDADPGQFLWLIDHADSVVSSSFHGAALALNFNKPTVPVINPASPSRLNSLLSTLDCPALSIEDLAKTAPDFTQVNRKIAEEKDRAMAYLKEVLAP